MYVVTGALVGPIMSNCQMKSIHVNIDNDSDIDNEIDTAYD